MSLFIDLLGLPLLISLALLCCVLTTCALFLAIKLRQKALLLAFLPLTCIPTVVGTIATFTGMLGSVFMQLDETNQFVVEPALLLQMNLLPILLGMIASFPPALTRCSVAGDSLGKHVRSRLFRMSPCESRKRLT